MLKRTHVTHYNTQMPLVALLIMTTGAVDRPYYPLWTNAELFKHSVRGRMARFLSSSVTDEDEPEDKN